jgi:agmatinase
VSKSRYRPVDALSSPRFAGIKTFMRLPHERTLDEELDFAVAGFPFDTTTSFRPGARFGPEAVRSASVLLRPYHRGHDLDLFEEMAGIDWGDVSVRPGDTQGTFEAAERELKRLADARIFLLVVGGDHSVTLPQLRQLSAVHGPLALIQLDAHSDTADEYYGQKVFHGTPFRRAVEEGLVEPGACVQLGLRGSLYSAGDADSGERLGFTVLTAEDVRREGIDACASLVKERVAGRPAFLTFDIDFLDPAYAPATGVPEVGGFTTWEAASLLRGLSGIRLVAADVVEVSPPYDSPGQHTAVAAANMAWELLALGAIARGRRPSPPLGIGHEKLEESS